MPDTLANALRLPVQSLARPFSPEQFSFASTDELEPFRGVLGQERAVEAMQFGVAMPRPGYNLYVMGESGTGRFPSASVTCVPKPSASPPRATGCISTISPNPASPMRWVCRPDRRPASAMRSAS